MIELDHDGPLVGAELERARELLTGQQLRAYGLFRSSCPVAEIARLMGVKRATIYGHIGKAEKKLGYSPTFTPKRKKKKTAVELGSKWSEAERAFLALDAAGRESFLRAVDPFCDDAFAPGEIETLGVEEILLRIFRAAGEWAVGESEGELKAPLLAWAEKSRRDRWAEIRVAVLRRARGRCELRIPGCRGRAVAVAWDPAARREEATIDDCRAACESCKAQTQLLSRSLRTDHYEAPNSHRRTSCDYLEDDPHGV